eukprot:CAMPEP_0202394640 /NCGR_PEP_ID=MMETSP1127-20130417/93544_1 /ASSEMBLY_ACC=CAM_ASM_000462 /TAXON_ID=3047 /ORGANISM="Dunaliella tertiolecta, Strain CCMP1320" /LENGTH=357 /DNA_ID=CAMNT_0048997285 /DNA_START=82 /DNA_END=1152 /DNA_ORIENTATION=-
MDAKATNQQHNAKSKDAKQLGQNKAEGVVRTTILMPYSFWKAEFKCRLLPAVLDCLVEVNGRLRPDTHKIVVSPSLKVTGLHALAVERYGGFKIMGWSKADSRTVVWHLRDPKSYRHLRHVQRQQEAAAMAAAAAAAAASESKQAEPKLQQGGISSNANPSPMSSALHDAKAATTNSEEASPCSLTMFKEARGKEKQASHSIGGAAEPCQEAPSAHEVSISMQTAAVPAVDAVSGGTGNFGEGSRLLAAEGTAKQDMAGAATRPAPEKEGKGATSAHVDDRAGSGGPCLGVDGDGGGRAASDYPKGASGTAGRRATGVQSSSAVTEVDVCEGGSQSAEMEWNVETGAAGGMGVFGAG